MWAGIVSSDFLVPEISRASPISASRSPSTGRTCGGWSEYVTMPCSFTHRYVFASA
jgi:hypothetical protein